jgi:hypothetical protein
MVRDTWYCHAVPFRLTTKRHPVLEEAVNESRQVFEHKSPADL